MKLNNKGFGIKESIIYLSILLLILLIASCSVSSFYDSLEKSRNENYQESYLFDTENPNDDDVVKDDEDDSNVINYEYYYEAEDKFETAAINYATSKGLTDSEITVYLDELVKLGFMENKIVDYVSGKTCSGYVILTYNNFNYDSKGYILCTNYKTEGFR